MAFLLPATFQKRLFRYALSQLTFLDMAAFDLDRLEGAWGSRNTGEIRDIPFKVDKLAELLSLPPWVKISKAKVLRLRLTVPVAIWREGIEVEIDGVEISCTIARDEPKEKEERMGEKTRQSRSTQPRKHDPGGDGQNALTSVEAMAQSFVEHEPETEKEEIRSVLAKQQSLDDSQISTGSGEDVGVAPVYTLPGMAADFLWGVAERVRITLKNIVFEVEYKLETPSLTNTSSSAEPVSLRLAVGQLEIRGVQAPTIPTADEPSATTPVNHHIEVKNVQGFVVSDPMLFEAFSNMSAPPSPAITHASTFRRDNSAISARSTLNSPSPSRRSNSSGPASLSESQEIAMSRSTIFDAPPEIFRSMLPDESGMLETSQITSEGDHLADSTLSSRYHGFGSEAEVNQFEDYSSPDQSFLESGRLNGRDEFSDALADSETLPNTTISRGSPVLQRLRTWPAPVPNPSSILSESASIGPPPSQLFQLASDNRTSDVGASTNFEQSSVESTIFHDFSNSVSPEMRGHESGMFHETNSGTDPDSEVGDPGSPPPSDQLVREDPTSEASTPTPGMADLMQSTLFTTDQAQSMYLSVLTADDSARSVQMHIPGGWNVDDEQELHPERPVEGLGLGKAIMAEESIKDAHMDTAEDETESRFAARSESVNSAEQEFQAAAHTTGLQPSPARSHKRFLNITKVSLSIPAGMLRQVQSNEEDPNLTSKTSAPQRMAGEFSAYENSRLERSVMRASITAARQESFNSNQDDVQDPIVVSVDKIELINDMCLTKLAVASLQQLNEPKSPVSVSTSSKDQSREMQPFELTIDRMSWAFVDSMEVKLDTPLSDLGTASLHAPTVLLVTRVSDLHVSQKPYRGGSMIETAIGRFSFGYRDEPILSFDSSVKMRESVRDVLAPTSKDVSITVKLARESSMDVTVMTLPLHIVLDLRCLDETFGWFGGLDGMLGLGSSVMSATTIVDTKPPAKPVRVHFDVPKPVTMYDEKTAGNTGAKVTARIGGLLFDVHGKSSSLSVEGSALKLVHRAEGLGMRIDKLRFSGPHVGVDDAIAPIVVNFGPLSIEYLLAPKEQDLARLIGLLSPSNQREDTESDDILIDTLLRQRRKGGLLRLNIEKVNAEVQNTQDLDQLSSLLDEMKKLATVTKYLPEDDSPGAMILSLIEEINVNVLVNKQFGSAAIKFSNTELALVTMPYLLLLGLDSINALHNGKRLIGEALAQKPRDRRARTADVGQQLTPMLLVQFVGNDLEPTCKVKVWNMAVEYHVSVLMLALGIPDASAEEVVAEMVHSIAAVAETRSHPSLPSQPSGLSDTSTGVKTLRIDVGLRDCVLVLNPLGSPAQGVIVFTASTITAAVPRTPNSKVNVTVELRQSSFLVVNDIATLIVPEQSDVPGLTFAPIYGSGHKLAFQKMGYVHTADISSALLSIKLSAKSPDDSRTMDIDFSDKLFVIDSCADSTQTMISVLSGLSPPTPPSTDPKYRTEIEPVQDMLASFTGDAFIADDDAENTYEHIESSQEETFEFDNSPSNSVSSSSSDLATKLGYNLPDTSNTLSTRAEKGRDKGPNRRIKLNFRDDFYVKKDTWDGKAQEWNSTGNVYSKADPAKLSRSPLRLRIRDIHVIWNLYDGYDWQHTRDVIGDAVDEVERKAAERQALKTGKRLSEGDEEEDSVIGDFLFNSIYIGVGAKNDPRDLARQVNRNLADDSSEADSFATPTTVISASPSTRGVKTRRRRLRLDRSKHHKITFELKGISADVVVYPPNSGETFNSIDLRIKDLEIFDHIHTSTWKKFATYMHDAGPREADMPMIHVELLNVKPIPELAASEIVLRLSILPLRLHVDQDALDFITRFFEFKDTTATKQPVSPAEQPFLQRVEVNSVPLKLDFKPKRVDYAGLRSGRTTEFMNFIVLEGSDMVLQHVIIYGVSGFERLGKTLNDIWTPDVKANQLPGVLAGLAPVRGIVNVGSGIKNLVVVPMREYRKDGHLVRAIQKGAVTFAKTTSTELAKLGTRLALGTQTVLQNAEGMLSGGMNPEDEIPGNIATTAGADDEVEQYISPYAEQPLGVLAGARGAWRHLERDLLLAKNAIIAIPGEIREQGSAQGAAKAVLRAAPTVILRPAMGVSKATGTMLMGATNALDKQERRRNEDKYKRF